MKIRTSQKTITFRRPFLLEGYEDELPAGHYLVETEEELLDGLSFISYQRVSCRINLQPDRKHPGTVNTLIVAPAVLDAALAHDQAPAASRLDLPSPGKPAYRFRKSA